MMRARGQDGFILVATLVVLALLTTIAGGTALLMRAAIGNVRTDSSVLERDALVRAGVELAAYQLFSLRLPPDRVAGEFRLADGVVQIAVRDETGLIDLNWSDPALLAAAAMTARLQSLSPTVFAETVVAWRSRGEPRNGSDGQRAPIPNVPAVKRNGFTAVEDLRWLPGLTDTEVAALSGLVTVHNPSGKVNLLVAPLDVLLALPGSTPQTAATIAALRRSSPDRIAQQASGYVDSRFAHVNTSSSAAFRVHVTARRSVVDIGAVSAILIRSPSDEAPYLVTQWREGPF